MGAGAVAGAAPVLHCGETITASMTLRSNLTCSGYDGDALVIAGRGVTLNMGGHSITGGFYDTDGIYVEGTHVTVEDGKIQYYVEGIGVEYAYDDTFTNMTFYDDEYGVDIEEAELTTVSFSHFDDLTTAVWVDEIYDSTVRNNTIDDAFYGVLVEDYSYGSTFKGNAVTDVYGGFVIFIATLTTVYDNHIYGGFFDITDRPKVGLGKATPYNILPDCYEIPPTGVFIDNYGYEGDGVKPYVSPNTTPKDDGYGYDVTVDGNWVEGFYWGIYIGFTYTGNVSTNLVAFTDTTDISLGFASSANLMNNVTDDAEDGIYLYDPYDVAIHNSTASYDDDGIYIYNTEWVPGASVTASTAAHNYEYGFYAWNPVPGKGNVTSDNGDPAYNVTT